MFEAPPPRTPSVSKTEKENVSLADTFRSPDLDTSYSKGHWHKIAIQAAARANGELYEKWKELPLTHALDLQPDGKTLLLGRPMHYCISCLTILCRGQCLAWIGLVARTPAHNFLSCGMVLAQLPALPYISDTCMEGGILRALHRASDGAPFYHHAAIPLARLCVWCH